MAEFEKVGEGFKIVITSSSSGKSWTCLMKENSLKAAQRTFRTFVKSWNAKEPLVPEDFPGFPISEEHDIETVDKEQIQF